MAATLTAQVAAAARGVALKSSFASPGPQRSLYSVPLTRHNVRTALRHPQGFAKLVCQARQTNAEEVPVTERTIVSTLSELIPADCMKQVRPLALSAMNFLMVVGPALAEEEGKAPPGKIFDFNLTLPAIAIQFLLLMVVLDNVWFKPLGKVMDERDGMIREKLSSVRDNSEELGALQKAAEEVIRKARAETTTMLANMKKETAAKLEAQLAASRSRIEKELAAALKNLEDQKKETLSSLDKQVHALSQEIIQKVLPSSVRL